MRPTNFLATLRMHAGIKPWHFINEMPVAPNVTYAKWINQFHLGATGYPQLMKTMRNKGAAIKAKAGPHSSGGGGGGRGNQNSWVAAQAWLSTPIK